MAVVDLQDQLAVVEQVGTQVGSAVLDSCETGQHNFKVDDDYDVRCTVQVSAAYQIDGDNFREVAEQVSDTFPPCESGESETEAVLRDYWDKLEGTETKNFDGPYRPDFLPSYRLACVDESHSGPQFEVTEWATLPVEEEVASLHEEALGGECISREDTPCTRTGDTVADVWERAGDSGWVVFVTGTTTYATAG